VTLLIALLAALATYLLITGLTRTTPRTRRTRTARRRSRPSLDLRLRQAGVTVSPSRYRATVAASMLGTFLVGYGLTGTLALGVIPAAVVGFAPRSYYRRRQRKALAARMAAWPEAIRDVLSHLTVGSTLHSALVQLGRSGPEPLRPVWRRYAVNATVLEVPAALDEARTELADPVSDRVIEAFAAAHERGQSVVVDVLRTLADDVTKDLQLNEQIITNQTEVRAQAVVAALLPFFVLFILVSTNDGFRDFYRTTAGFVVICLGAGMAFIGWKLISALGRLPDDPRVLAGPPSRSTP
jgi:tight adherence protein B